MTKPEFTAGQFGLTNNAGTPSLIFENGDMICIIADFHHYVTRQQSQKIVDRLNAAPDLYDALSDFVGQYGCHCGHPACRTCADTRHAESALRKAGGAE